MKAIPGSTSTREFLKDLLNARMARVRIELETVAVMSVQTRDDVEIGVGKAFLNVGSGLDAEQVEKHFVSDLTNNRSSIDPNVSRLTGGWKHRRRPTEYL
jgi:hypothetical protein